MVAKLSLVECMAVVEDPRIDRTKAHSLLDILVLSVLAVLCGAEGWEDIELFGKIRLSWLRKFIKLKNGVPSHDTISRVFRMIKPDEFHEAFLEWVRSLDMGSEGLNVIAIDGKSLRRSHDRKTFKNMLHSVAAWSVANRVVLGCQSVDQKSNEITAIPELLKKLELKGAIITMDAMGSQKEVAAQIIDGEGDYVLAIKDNHPTLADAMREYFDSVHESGLIENGIRHHHTSEAKHGRQENRYYYQSPIPDSLKELTKDWKGAKSIGQVHNITMRDGKETSEVRYYLSSKPVSVKRFAEAVRAHWGIENSFHWVLDMTFNEDQSRIRKDHGPDNFALLRRFAINILNQDTSKESTRKKRKRAAWDENYLLNRLAAII
jgi:predicted transposase YbfD/YdcC